MGAGSKPSRSGLWSWIRYALADGRGVRSGRRAVELIAEAREMYPPGAEDLARFTATQDELRGLLRDGVPRVSLERYQDNLRAMTELAQQRGARVILLGSVFGRSTSEPLLADSTIRTPVRDYREVMRDVSREFGAGFVALPMLAESSPGTRGQLFVSRALDPGERAFFAAIPPAGRAGRGLSLEGGTQTYATLPSASGHKHILGVISDLLARE